MYMKVVKAFCPSVPMLLILFIPMIADAMSFNPPLNLRPGGGTWETGCQFSNGETRDVLMRGFWRLRIKTPCSQLKITSQYRGTKSGTLPANADFQEILTGRAGNWFWQILGTPLVAHNWPRQGAGSCAEYDGKPYGPAVSWPDMFAVLHSIYEYVLGTTPPASKFSLYYFPGDISVNRAEYTPTKDSISLPLYLPFDISPPPTPKAGKPQLTPEQVAYMGALQIACFEYMHALFFAKHLKPMNILTQSVADSVTCTGVELVTYGRSVPNVAITFPSANSLDISSAEEVANKQNDVDYLAIHLATRNIAHLLGGDAKQVSVRARDTAKVLQILQLARAMLQEPVGLTYQLYPLKRAESQPVYPGISATAASGG